MDKFEAKEIRELSEYVKANRKKIKTRHEEIQAAKTVSDKIQKVVEFIIGPKHKPAERMAIFDPVTNELITDENKILATTLKYNIGVLTKNNVQQQDIPEAIEKITLHESVMKDTTKGEPLSEKTYKDVIAHLKKKNKNMFRHINKAGQ